MQAVCLVIGWEVFLLDLTSIVHIVKYIAISIFTSQNFTEIHRIHRRQHASKDDAGMSKHRLSPHNAYYHNWLT